MIWDFKHRKNQKFASCEANLELQWLFRQSARLLSTIPSIEQSRQSKQYEDQSQNSQREYNEQCVSHIYPFKFNNLRLASQKTRAVAEPTSTGMIRNSSSKEGSRTEATATMPRSAQISASFSNWISDNRSFTSSAYTTRFNLSTILCPAAENEVGI